MGKIETMRSLVEALKITCTSEPTAPRPGWDAGASHWRVTLRMGHRRMTVAYSMGSAHRGEPDCADVLACVASDSRSADESFEDWAREYGYDTDSRSAEKTWRECQRSRVKLTRFAGVHLDRILGAEH